ncbi:uncharacterized protein LOC119107731 [Pollicipes pollicipes]|uniref:uncharacterized protein LOC119107603 n=1 Tax=Pollicipes pollicipes TaxID=41117 RepID=UPI00188516A3|nr:uncharacterized protein LOC119107603 [Pollicipes pollicipes]XP_037087000.1 uncharacterized protein LOC119107603 [Pollicipes pollicipes]XP_037087001.1 uncharacterized protein LOC119107603 [Pollicipes pollicipes]XP_037087167.1 uncharacterized protein LOC119107731 [Pollicipes pollicipes]XP_037087168.1 uncharacterized protein LOC119107731 [Pollicipes pollicipes]XP_037087169.1 uncharacterized protein LOC119107731 [Pollicipes pollicipes]
MTSFFKGYQYYDTKDGEDCHKKIWFMTKTALVFSAWAAPSYCALVTKPVGAWQTAHGLGYITIPMVTSAATFAATACALTNLRGKDDLLNPMAGGFAAGSIFGAWKHCMWTGARWGGIFAVTAFFFKAAEQDKWYWWESPNFPQKGTVAMWKHDWTLRKDPTKTESQ